MELVRLAQWHKLLAGLPPVGFAGVQTKLRTRKYDSTQPTCVPESSASILIIISFGLVMDSHVVLAPSATVN